MFKTVKTSELIGEALDWAVAKCEGYAGIALQERINTDWYSPSTEWVQGGPIIEKEGISFNVSVQAGINAIQNKPQNIEKLWVASYLSGSLFYGASPLVATMRCYVASKLGDSVEVPEELLKD